MAFGTSHVTGSTQMHRPKDGAVSWDVFVTAFATLMISDDLFHFGKS